MTAVVGILNKQAVAIAADSAVTISGTNGRKIFNKANKVFTLSKYHPIGVMIYNSASFMQTPWETIIKMYRKQLGSTSFPTVKAYQENFFEFLREKHFFANTDDEKMFLYYFIMTLTDTVIKEVKTSSGLPNGEELLPHIESKIDTYIDQFSADTDFCPELENYTFEEFDIFVSNFFPQLISDINSQIGTDINAQLQSKIKQLAFYFLKIKEHLTNYTGLIFTGFGEEEIYPALTSVNISMTIQGRLRYYVDEVKCASISTDNNGAICPFAQTDVIDTILTGIDPTLDDTYLSNFGKSFSKYNQEILKIIADSNPDLTAQIQALDIKAIVDEYSKMNQQIKRENYISPLMNAVSSLSKEDLAEMAESLIYLTYLKRRITFAEESVGGPVDVAIISKGDGFIWIKRKHYFKPELNQHFFDNYFK